MTPIFDIHLLVESIGEYLSRRDLSCCALVCNSWHISFTAILWRTLPIYSSPKLAWLRTAIAQHSLSLHGHNIRSIVAYFAEIPPPLLSSPLQNLSALKILRPPDSSFVQLFVRSNNLQRLEMVYFQEPSTSPPPLYINQFLTRLRSHPRLRDFRVTAIDGISKLMAYNLFLSCGNIQRLHYNFYIFNSKYDDDDDDDNDDDNYDDETTPATFLEYFRAQLYQSTGVEKGDRVFKVSELELGNNCAASLGDILFLTFLRLCPNVRRLSVPSSSVKQSSYPNGLDPLLDIVTTTMTNLRHLNEVFKDYHGPSSVSSMIEASNAGLESFFGRSLVMESDDKSNVFSALLKHHNTLTSVELCGIGRYNNNDNNSNILWDATGSIQILLCTCPHLQRFIAQSIDESTVDIFHSRQHDSLSAWLAKFPGSESARLPTWWSSALWACSGLRVLRLEFKSRPRLTTTTATTTVIYDEASEHMLPDSECDGGGGDGSCIEFIPEILVRQLGRLHDLQELTLRRFPCDDIVGYSETTTTTRRQQALGMLSTLSTLQKLCYVRLMGIEQVYCAEEIEQAKQCWTHIHSVQY